MNEIKRFNLAALNNGNYYQFIESIVAIGRSETAVQIVLANLVSDLERLQTSFKKEQLNTETSQIIVADELRDRAFIKLRKKVGASLYDDQSAANKAAATELDNILKLYGGGSLATFDYNKESAHLTNLVKDLEDKTQAAVETLGLSDDVTYLKTCNENFIELYAKRGDAAQLLGNIPPFSKLRKEVNGHYYTFIVYVESLYRVNAAIAPQIETLISRINVEVEKYKLLLNKAPEKPPAADI